MQIRLSRGLIRHRLSIQQRPLRGGQSSLQLFTFRLPGRLISIDVDVIDSFEVLDPLLELFDLIQS